VAFTVVFYGVRIFGCKTAHLSGTQREWLTTETPSIRDAVQASENSRKNSLLNYESPALTAELQARRAARREHRTFNVQRPIFTPPSEVNAQVLRISSLIV
jgi:hypothetical protein